MAVLRQTWITDNRLDTRMVTADIRLTRRASGWTVTEIRSAEAVDVSVLLLPDRTSDLLNHDGVDLPDVALADLADGVVRGEAPDVRVDRVEDGPEDTAAFVHGSVTVPNYLMPRQTQFYGVRWEFWN
jgi:hypothetical protein